MLFGSSCPPVSLLPAAPLRCFLRVALALCWHYRPADIMAATGKQRQVNSDRCLRPPAAARNVSRKTVFNHSKKFGSDSESFVSEPGGRVQTGADTRRFRFGGERETNTWRQKEETDYTHIKATAPHFPWFTARLKPRSSPQVVAFLCERKHRE